MNYIIRSIAYDLIRIIHRIKNKNLILGYKSEVSLESSFEGYNKISHHTYFNGRMGLGSYIGENSIVVGEVGKFCSIGGNVVCLCSTHPTKVFVSTSPSFYSLQKQNGMTFISEQKFDEFPKYDNSNFPIIIGNDVYIGYGATLIAPIRIGDGSIIAAKAVVTKDVEPYTIVGGCPAKEIRKRFDKDQIRYLMDFKWWNRDIKWLKRNSDFFDSIDAFINFTKESEL